MLKLPTEAELAAQYESGIDGTQRAVQQLEADGPAKRWPGKGFYRGPEGALGTLP